ncbi:MAG: adenylate/guanylate cyclase domain-containing protein [Legionella sp.]|jgi:adenylate cyclase
MSLPAIRAWLVWNTSLVDTATKQDISVAKDRRFLSKVNKTTWIEIILGLVCTGFILLTELYDVPIISTYIKKLENQIYDEVVTYNLRSYNLQPKVIIIDIDESSIEKEGRWPWPRDKMARLLTILKQAGIVSFGVDIVMPEAEINYADGLKHKLLQMPSGPTPEDQILITNLEKIAPQFDNDKILAQTFLDHNIVLGFLFDNDPGPSKGTLPAPLSYQITDDTKLDNLSIYKFLGYIASLDEFMKASTKGGFVTNYPDADGVVRRTVLLGVYKGNLYPSLALSTAMNYLLVDKPTLLTHNGRLYGIQLDGTFIPTNAQGQSLIPFWGPPGTLDYYSAADILENKVDLKQLQGTVAIVGSSITLLADLHQSPIGPSFPGVEMVGNIVQAVISQKMPSEYDWHTNKGLAMFLGLGLVFAFLLPILPISLKLIISLLTLLSIIVTTFYIFGLKNLYIPIAFIVILVLLESIINFAYSFIIERLQKRKISQLFGQYVPEEYVKELIDEPDKSTMEGRTLEMTVLFADIRSFTSISETLDAVNVKHLLNTFFTPITEIIFSFRGTIDKYVGDMVVAFWGAPIEDKDHAKNAILTSLTIFKKLPEINSKMIEANLPAVNIGVGLSTGLMNVGDMGSEFRRAYTVLGDTVNLGSRLQDLTKFYKVNVLVSTATQAGQTDFIWRPIDKVSVKGRKTALIIYEPICTAAEATPALVNELEEYQLALADYYAQKWSLAEKKFRELVSSYPEIYVYQMYLERIQTFKTNPPHADWEGVHEHHSK